MPRFALLLAILCAPLLAMTPVGSASAQSGGGIGSAGYRFLNAVREGKGDDVTSLLNGPGATTLINTRDQSTGETALHIVVKRSDSTYTNFLLSRGADPNLRDDRGNTPLLLAVTQGDDGVVSILLDGNANVNLANQSGETPLIRAVQTRSLPMVRLLLQHQADPDQRDVVAGLSARDYATRDPRAQVIAAALAEVPPRQRRNIAGPHL